MSAFLTRFFRHVFPRIHLEWIELRDVARWAGAIGVVVIIIAAIGCFVVALIILATGGWGLT